VTAGVPIPDPADEVDAAFWRALRDGELRVQQCSECRAFRHPPRPACAQCGATDSDWTRAAGTGEVWSYTIVHPPTLPAFADRVPYGAVVVRLDEGVFLVSNLVDCPVDELAVGTRVELAPTRVVAGPETGDDVVLPLFRRARPG
jgi:uncharacterized OB-fold protein